MKRIYGLCLGLALAMGSVVLAGAGARADEFTPAQKAELGAFIKDYLVKHPDVLRAAIEALDKHDKDVAEARAQEGGRGPVGSVVQLEDIRPTVGNPKGAATLVEFFDYNCHYCKGALPDITRLMKDDPNLQARPEGFPGARAGLGRGRPRGDRRAQPVAGRQVLGFPHEAAGDARPDRQGRGAVGRQGPRARHGQARQGHGESRRSRPACTK